MSKKLTKTEIIATAEIIIDKVADNIISHNQTVSLDTKYIDAIDNLVKLHPLYDLNLRLQSESKILFGSKVKLEKFIDEKKLYGSQDIRVSDFKFGDNFQLDQVNMDKIHHVIFEINNIKSKYYKTSPLFGTIRTVEKKSLNYSVNTNEKQKLINDLIIEQITTVNVSMVMGAKVLKYS